MNIEDIKFFASHNPVERVSHEIQRARQRIIIGSFFTSISLFFLFKNYSSFDYHWQVPVISIMYSLLSVYHWIILKRNAKGSLFLQYFFFSIDCPLVVYLMSVMPNELSFFYPTLLFATFGVGIRFGRKIMLLSLCCALIPFILSIIFVPYWREHENMTIGVLLTILVLPLYFISLIKRVEKISGSLHEMAMKDTLTGLGNRRMLMDELETRKIITDKSQRPLTVFYFDLDNFKEVNDKLGHKMGDNLLVGMANKLKKEFRCKEFIARMGGDEFVMLSFTKDKAEEEIIANKILNIAKSTHLEVCPLIPVSASVGIETYNGKETKTIDEILTMADSAMYRAKTNGKDTFCFLDDK